MRGSTFVFCSVIVVDKTLKAVKYTGTYKFYRDRKHHLAERIKLHARSDACQQNE